MNDYPTRAEIDATRATLRQLQNAVDRSAPGWCAMWSALDAVREILTNLDAFPGLHYPAPEPKPTANRALMDALRRSTKGTPEETILFASIQYEKTHPEWFADLDWSQPEEAFYLTRNAAREAGDQVACNLLWAASELVTQHPELFGDPA